MKLSTASLVVVLGSLLALPAASASPSHDRGAAARLRADVKRLTLENRRLRAELRSLGSISERRQYRLLRHVAVVDPCPITQPNGSDPPGPTFGAEFHGNGALWVGLWPANVVVWEAEGGAVAAKFGWWREARGRLRIEGRRLDGQAEALTATIPDGYGDSGFQATRIRFPAEGCWEITGSVGAASLTFVTRVLAP